MITVINRNFEYADVTITRPTLWGNSYTHLPYALSVFRTKTRDESILMFALLWYSEDYRALRHLALNTFKKNARLGCVCKPKSCHGDIIAGYVNWRRDASLA